MMISLSLTPLVLFCNTLWYTILTRLGSPSQHRHTREEVGRNWVRDRERKRETILSPRYDGVTHAGRSHMEGGGRRGGGGMKELLASSPRS